MTIRRTLLLLVCQLCSVCIYGQSTTTNFDFKKAEKALESVMNQHIEDKETREQCATIASYVGIHQFSEHRYNAAVRSFEYAINNIGKDNDLMQIMNHVFLVHSLCLTNNRKALTVLQNLTPMLQEMQANTVRGNFPYEYADGMRTAMNSLLLPLTSLVSKTFSDKQTREYCFNLMLFLKQFSFYQLTNRQTSDIKYNLFINYKDAICHQLRPGEIAIEFVPFMDIVGNKVNGISYAAYILSHTGSLDFVEVCRKDEVEMLYNQNESSWMLYSDNATGLRSIIWKKLESYVVNKKKIYVSPCGILNRVNFILFNSKVYELTTTPELIKTYRNSYNKKALLIGDVDYNNSIANTQRGDRDWGLLRGTKKEIESIDKSLSSSYSIRKLTNNSVTEQNVRDLCNQTPDILHFATHAICYTDSTYRRQLSFFNFPYTFNPIKPELTYSGLILSGGNKGFRRINNVPIDNDGIFLAEEITKLNLNGTTLVVLSACDSGNGIFDDIEGTLGLVTAFKIAGAKTVIASLSKVDDDAASEMMSEFYNRMAGKESMHNAFVNTINYMKKRYPHTPKKWAAFKIIDCYDINER